MNDQKEKLSYFKKKRRPSSASSESASKNFAYWQMRCELICPSQTKDAIQEIVNTNENPEKRLAAHQHLKSCLSEELRRWF
jgi:hypothetical protein